MSSKGSQNRESHHADGRKPKRQTDQSHFSIRVAASDSRGVLQAKAEKVQGPRRRTTQEERSEVKISSAKTQIFGRRKVSCRVSGEGGEGRTTGPEGCPQSQGGSGGPGSRGECQPWFRSGRKAGGDRSEVVTPSLCRERYEVDKQW